MRQANCLLVLYLWGRFRRCDSITTLPSNFQEFICFPGMTIDKDSQYSVLFFRISTFSSLVMQPKEGPDRVSEGRS